MIASTSLPRGEIIQQMDGTYELFPVPPEQETLLAIIYSALPTLSTLPACTISEICDLTPC